MALNESNHQVALPPELQTRFAGLTHRLWTLETAAAVCGAAAALAGTWLAVFVSDRFWESPVWFRTACALIGTAGWAYAVTWWLRRWVFRRRDLRSLANLVQRAHRRLGDRLLGIVELAGERQHTAGFSPELYRAAIQQVAGEAVKVDFEAAVSLRPARVQGALLGVFLLLVSAAALLSPATGWNTAQRWFLPWADIPRQTLVEIVGLPERQIVAHGEPFEVTARVEYRSRWRPAKVSIRLPGQLPVATTVESGQIRVRLPGQVEPGQLRMRVGDSRQTMAVDPTYRPTLRQLAAEVEWPAYLYRTNSQEKIEDGTLTLLEGSQVAFRGEASRPLKSAEYRLGVAEPEPLALSNAVFRSGPTAISLEGQAEFNWVDHLGLAAAGPWRLGLQTRKDNAPAVELPELPRDVGLLETEVLNVKVAARDDFGVRDLGLLVEMPPDAEGASAASWPDFKTDAPQPRPPEHSASFAFSPSVFRIPPNTTVELRGFASDDLPGRRSVQSVPYRVHILSNERHAEMVRQRMEALLAQLEEVTRLEEKVAEDARNLSELSPEKQAAKETGDRISGVNEEQKQSTRNLEQMAREGLQALREAIRNPAFKSETVSDWAKTLQEMQRLAGQEMPKASESLESARQSQARRAEKLAEAQQKAQQIAESLQKLQSKVNSDLDELQALTLAQRLRRLAEGQKEISTGLQKIVPDTVGFMPSELPPGLARANQRLSTNQTGVQVEATTVQGEISRFFERTRRPNYGEVSKDMVDLRTGEELDRVRGLITDNIALDAVANLVTWSKRFEDWAAKLEPPPDENSSGQGEGGEQGNDEMQKRLLKMLMTLLRTREGQVTLQEQTRLLDRQREPTPQYLEGTTKLSTQEEELIGRVGGLRRENPVVELNGPLAEAEMRMVETLVELRRPRTDQPALTAHARSVEALSDVINLINEQAKKNPSPGQSKEPGGDEMSFLTQMMAQQPTIGAGMPMPSGGGGNLAGGDTDSVDAGGPGSAAGRAADGRSPTRAGGAAMRNVPSEFREALEDYYRAVEAEENQAR